MTSHELAKRLLTMPDVMVTRRGYEGGVQEITEVNEPKPILLNINEEWFYGKHEYDREKKSNILAIHIN